MTKEADPAPPKKRKQQEAPDATNGSTEAKTSKLDVDEKKNNAKIYQRVNAFDEAEAPTRDPTVDLEQYKQLCQEFANRVSRVSDLMISKPAGWADEVKESRMEAGLLTVFMKKLNRVEKIRNRNARENVTKVRQQVDVSQLQLQNLMCEILHLNREVEKCILFKSKPLGVDLVPVEEFYAAAPEKIARPEITQADEHQLLLARLEWELQQRKELSILCSKLDEKKKTLSTQISNRTSDLESLAPLIKNVLESTKPLQEKLGFNAGQSSLTPDKASLLPHCLYFLYIQAKAYKDAIDENITVEIKSDDEATKSSARIGDKDAEVSSGEGSDNDNPEKTSKKDSSEKIERRKKKLFEKHSLYVSIKINFKDKSCLILDFYYWLKLNVVTVVSNLELANNQLKSSDAGEQLYGKNLLVNLFPGDDGTISPNVSNYYQLNEVGLEALDTKKLGFPYVWAQKIAGLDFTSVGPDSKVGGVEPNLETAKAIIPVIVKILRRRVNSRMILAKQVVALESKTIVGPPAMKSVKLSCSLKSWKSIAWNDFVEHPASEQLRDIAFATPQDIYFSATVSRGKAKLTILVVAKCDYPLDPPKFAIQIDWNDSMLNASNSAKIREMEKEVNVHWKELTKGDTWSSTLLIYQIHRIMVSFDIFLECSDPVKFSAEKKTFLHPHSGRCRSLPLKYVPMGEGVFLRR